MNFAGTVNAGVSKLAKSMKNSVSNCRTEGKIAEQQKKIKVLTREIGNLTLVRLEAGDEMSTEIMERYAAIKEAKEMISTLKQEKKKTAIVCQECGKKTSVDMKYCGVCGSCLKEA